MPGDLLFLLPASQFVEDFADEIIIDTQITFDSAIGVDQFFIGPNEKAFEAVVGARLIVGATLFRCLLFFGEIVKGDGFAGHFFRALDGIGEAVVRILVRIENNTAVEDRTDALGAFLHVTCPQFEFTAVFGLPSLVEINQEIDPPAPVALMRVHGEVGVDVQVAAAL